MVYIRRHAYVRTLRRYTQLCDFVSLIFLVPFQDDTADITDIIGTVDTIRTVREVEDFTVNIRTAVRSSNSC